MPLFFPPTPDDGEAWEDSCGAVWYYDKTNNSWAKPVDTSAILPSPFVRSEAGEITPRNDGDDFNMEEGLIDLRDFPTIEPEPAPAPELPTIGNITVTGPLEPTLSTGVAYTATHDGTATDVLFTFSTDDPIASVNGNNITFQTEGSFLITATGTSTAAGNTSREGTLRIITDPPGAPDNVPESDTSETRWCVAVIDEDVNQQSFAGNAANWTAFRANWPDRYHFVLEASRRINLDCTVSRLNTPVQTTVNGQDSCLQIPDNYKADLSEPYANWMPIKRVGSGSNTVNCAEDWYEMIGASRLPDNARICLFVDNSSSMYTSTVKHSYDLFVSKLSARGIDFFVVENTDENWIETFDREF